MRIVFLVKFFYFMIMAGIAQCAKVCSFEYEQLCWSCSLTAMMLLCLAMLNLAKCSCDYRSRSALKISEVQVTRSLQWTRWQMCLFLSGPSRRPHMIPMQSAEMRGDPEGSKMIKDDQRWSKGKRDQWPDVTWCDLDDAVSLWNLVNTRRGILEEMKNQNMLRFKASRRVPATTVVPPKGQVERILMLWHLPWKSLSHPALFMPRLCVYDYLGLFGIVCVFISRLAWLCSDSSSSVWLEVEETKSAEHHNFLSFFLSFLYVFLVPHSWVAVPFRV
jgi:hypothetical protein